MGEDIVGFLMDYRPFQPSFSGSLNQNRRFQYVIGVDGQNDSARDSTQGVSAATDSLDQPGRLSWRSVLDDEVNAADVDS
jgi:hypothetical protein